MVKCHAGQKHHRGYYNKPIDNGLAPFGVPKPVISE